MNDPNHTPNDSDDGELDDDDSDLNSIRTKPWDPSDIRVSTKRWSLRQVIDDIKDGSLDLAPDFQRDYVSVHT